MPAILAIALFVVGNFLLARMGETALALRVAVAVGRDVRRCVSAPLSVPRPADLPLRARSQRRCHGHRGRRHRARDLPPATDRRRRGRRGRRGTLRSRCRPDLAGGRLQQRRRPGADAVRRAGDATDRRRARQQLGELGIRVLLAPRARTHAPELGCRERVRRPRVAGLDAVYASDRTRAAVSDALRVALDRQQRIGPPSRIFIVRSHVTRSENDAWTSAFSTLHVHPLSIPVGPEALLLIRAGRRAPAPGAAAVAGHAGLTPVRAGKAQQVA